MCSPHALEFVSSVWKENIISSHDSWHIVRSSSSNHGSVVCVMGDEHLFEFSNTESSVSRLIVSSDHEVTLIKGWVDANGIESSLKLVNINSSVSWLIKDLESINNVEVWLVGKLDLGVLDLLLEVADLLQ